MVESSNTQDMKTDHLLVMFTGSDGFSTHVDGYDAFCEAITCDLSLLWCDGNQKDV